jgi:LuxR family maltose regulon positive regulatory protein
MLHAARGQQWQALAKFEAADNTTSRLTGEHALAPQVSGWVAATHARLARPDLARQSLAGLPAERAATGEIRNTRSVIHLAEGDPAAALQESRDVLDGTVRVIHDFTVVEAHLLAGIAHRDLGHSREASAAVEAALAAAEADRLILPFAMTDSLVLLETARETVHGPLLIEIVDLLRGSPAGARPPAGAEELSPTELRVLRYLPTNLTRPEIAHELFVSVNTVNTHIRNIYAKLGARDRSSAVLNPRRLKLLSSGRLQ